MKNVTMEDLFKFCKENGFIFPGSEIYGGLANSFDYGPLGVELKNNIKKAWWQRFVQENIYNIGLDAGILMNPETWVASGHVATFSDPLVDCKECKTRHRADKLIEDHSNQTVVADGFTNEQLYNYLVEHQVKCPNCGSVNYTEVRQFNLMFKTFQGVVENAKNTLFLRPETAQGIFVNFKNIQRSMRKKVPFGVCQIGKSFRNEITPGQFIFRTREFEQMELEFFCKPGTELEWFKYWKDYCFNFLTDLGINSDNLRIRDHEQEELSHYSNATSDIEVKFPFGFGELWGIASRTNYDLNAHQNHSKENLEYLDPETNEKYLPYVVEPSLGVERLLLAILFNSYKLEDNGQEREFLKIHPFLAPYKVCVLPLMKKYHTEKAMEVYQKLSKHFSCTYDDAGSIGKRYKRQDLIGTPFCITIDDNSLNENTVTIRFRDSMEQITLNIDEVSSFVDKLIKL